VSNNAKADGKDGGRRRSAAGGKISKRFLNINIALFLLAFFILTAIMLTAFDGVISKTTSDFAVRHAVSTAEAFSAHLAREIDLVARVARSEAVAEWLGDEADRDKMNHAFGEMASIVGQMYSYNLYIVTEGTYNEYRVDSDFDAGNMSSFTSLDRNNPEDSWYFTCIESENDYILNVNTDRIIERKRIWINYKIVKDGEPLGVVCTGLEFSHVAGELFSYYINNNLRGLLINRDGFVHMDSSMLSDKDFLYNASEIPVGEVVADQAVLDEIRSYLQNTSGYYAETIGEPEAIRLASGPYSHMTITPIRYSDWSVVILTGASTLFDMTYFSPVLLTVLVLLIIFALATSAANYRLIFEPLGKLNKSLITLKENKDGVVYGAEREDELGYLARTIEDLFSKANVDTLTGIYNRRFLESNLDYLMEFLSRANGNLSVMMFDIDYFKKYNDAFGHDKGDECLRDVARVLSGGVTRSNDFVARYGGEEFTAVLPNTDEAGARIVAEKLVKRIQALNIPHPDSDVADHVTISAGVTTGKASYMHNWESYVKRADEALYMSKQNGRNRYTFLDYDGAVKPGQETRK